MHEAAILKCRYTLPISPPGKGLEIVEKEDNWSFTSVVFFSL